MTAPLADPVANPAANLAAAAPIAWFTATACVFGIAWARNDHASERAAGWSLSLSLSICLLVVVLVVELLHVRARRLPRWRWDWLAAVGLTAGSGVVIWVAVDLVLINDSTGAWILLPPGATAALTGLVVALIRSSDRSAECENAVRERALPEPEVAEPEVAEPEVGEAFATPGQVSLVPPGTGSRIRKLGLAVALDQDFWRAAEGALAWSGLEQGGVALTIRLADTLLLFGAVFPRRLQAGTVRCEFPTGEVDRVRRAIDAVAGEIDGQVTLTWVHTHPGLGVFLSSTDQQTSLDWRSSDPSFTPIVIDATKQQLSKQIGVFDADGQQIQPIGLVPELVNRQAAQRLGSAIRETYGRDGLPDPLVLLPASTPFADRRQE